MKGVSMRSRMRQSLIVGGLLILSACAIVSDAGRSLLIYRFEQGQWKIAVDIDQATPDVAWPSPGGLLDR